MLRPFLLALVLAGPTLAQQPDSLSPSTGTISIDGVAAKVTALGHALVDVQALVSTMPESSRSIQGPIVGGDQPNLTASWTSDGVEITVSLPCASTTGSAWRRCLEQFQSMVASTKSAFPPDP